MPAIWSSTCSVMPPFWCDDAAFHDLARGSGLKHDGLHPLSGQATVTAAQKAGIKVHSYRDLVQIASANATAKQLVDARNKFLVDAITLVLDIVDPAALVLAGEAFVISSRRCAIDRSVSPVG